MSSADSLQFSRSGKVVIYISLALAILLVLGVLFGAKIAFDRATSQPVVMSDLPAPLSDSAECAQLIDTLPDEALGHDRAEIAEPVPAGVAAWASSSIERVTLRCGVDLPNQYDEYSEPIEVDGVRWLQIRDATPQSTLETWYTVDRSHVVAITADGPTMDGADNPVADLSEAVATLPTENRRPAPAPLSQLAGGDTTVCTPLMDNLPDTLTEDYTRIDIDEAHTAAWTAPGLEPVILRCGVAPPENYRPGEQLNQVNDIPWFEDTVLANATTSSTWFALGRATDIAVNLPQAAGSSAIVELGDLIVEHTPEQE